MARIISGKSVFEILDQCYDIARRGPGRARVFFGLKLSNRFGHLATEMFYLRNMFPVELFDHCIFIRPESAAPLANRAVLDIASRGMDVIESDDPEHYSPSWYKPGDDIAEADGSFVVLWPSGSPELYFRFLEFCRFQRPPVHLSLSEDDEERGVAIADKMGIPRNAKIVTLHVREEGYVIRPTRYHSFRNANIENYYDAIDYLVKSGYTVVRLGDATMRRLLEFKTGVVDLPFHADYEPLADPYFIAKAKFHLGMSSGPHSGALAFGTPILYANNHLSIQEWTRPGDLVIPKKFYSLQLQRFLTYSEILESRLPDLCRSPEFDTASIQLVENTPLEILQATQEMVARIEGHYAEDPKDASLNERILEAQERSNLWRAAKQMTPPFLPSYYSKLQFARSFLEAHPWFSGHYVPPAKVKQPKPRPAVHHVKEARV